MPRKAALRQHRPENSPSESEQSSHVTRQPAEETASPDKNQTESLTPNQQHLMALQQRHGNSVARRHAQTGNVQRFIFGGGPSLYEAFTPEQIQTAIDKKSGGDLIYMTNFEAATPTQRDQIAEIILAQREQFASYKVGLALQYLWNSYGTDLLTMDEPRAKLFERCAQSGMHIANIKVINQQLKPILIDDVRAIAKEYTDSNEGYLSAQLTKLGHFNQADVQAGKRQEIDDVRDIAKKTKDGQNMLDEMKKIPVGYEESWANYIRPVEGMMFDPTPLLTEVTFDPESRPRYESYGDAYPVHQATWDNVNALYQMAYATTAQSAGRSPAVYRAWVEGKLDAIIDSPPEQANHEATDLLITTYYDLLRARSKIDSVDALDMLPIIEQLRRGKKRGPSSLNWASPFLASAASGLVEKNKLENLASNIGLAIAGTAAFMLAEAATGGLATFALAGAGFAASGYQAYDSITKATAFGQLADSAVSEESRIISEGQASDAMISAVLDSVGLALDGLGAIGTAKRLTRMADIKFSVDAAKTMGSLDLKVLRALSPESAASAIRRGVDEHGIQKATELAGFSSPRELLPFAEKDPELLGRLRAYTDTADAATDGTKALKMGAQEGLAKIAAGQLTDPQLVEQVLANAIDTMGASKAIASAGGWNAFKSILPEGSEAGKRLFAWRDQIYQDLEAYITVELKGQIEHTGTYKNFKNDLDISFNGPDAASNRESAFQFLAQRTGFGRDQLNKNMLADLFTDSSRSHIYDQLDNAADRLAVAQSSTANARSLLYNRMLLDAEKEGPEAVARVSKKMDELGIEKIAGYRILDDKERKNMAMIVDSLHKEFEAATEPAKRRELAEKIANYQAQINVSEGGGYVTGGGVDRWVTSRKEFEKKQDWSSLTETPRVINKLDAIGNLYDQFAKLEHAMMTLGYARKPDEAIAALRDIGKYGFRMAEGQIPFASSHLDEVSDMIREFEAIKNLVDKGTVDVKMFKAHATSLFEWLDADSSRMLVAAADEAGLSGVKVDMSLLMAAMNQQRRAMQLKSAAKTGLFIAGGLLDVEGAYIGYQSGQDEISEEEEDKDKTRTY